MITCETCGYTGSVETFKVCLGVYNDIRCPECGSTNNEHNAEYQRRIFAKIREIKKSGGTLLKEEKP